MYELDWSVGLVVEELQERERELQQLQQSFGRNGLYAKQIQHFTTSIFFQTSDTIHIGDAEDSLRYVNDHIST